MTDAALLSRRIRDHVEAVIADGCEGDRLPTMGELRRRFGGASNGAVQQALEPLKASGAVMAARGPQGGHFIGPKASTEPRARCGRVARAMSEARSVGSAWDRTFGHVVGSTVL